MLVDYLGDSAPAFCAEGSGCTAVRHSGYGYWFDFLPVPLVGLVGFGSLLALSLVSRFERLTLYGAALGAAGGVSFLWIQGYVIGHFCSLCLVVDITSIVAFIAAILHQRAMGADKHLSGESHLRDGAWGLLALIVGFAPPIWTKTGITTTGNPALQSLLSPGKINVIEFADFECPYCRKVHPIVDELVHQYGDRVHVQRFMVPLPMHQFARGAAIAYLCGEKQGHADAMANELFAATALDGAALKRIAAKVGLNMAQFDACVTSPEVEASLAKTHELYKHLGLTGLPATFVGDEQIVGSRPPSVFQEAFERAARGDSGGGIPAWLYTSIVVALLIVVAWFGRVRD